jgi:hypothetical protein
MLAYNETSISVEIRMYNADKTELKAVMWSNYVHFNLLKQKRETHSEAFMSLFASVLHPVAETAFEKRIENFKKTKSAIE